MNKSTFNKNFDQAIILALENDDIDFTSLKFKLNPTQEEKGAISSKDEWMIYAALKNSLQGKEFVDYQESVRLMSAGKNQYPLWAKVTKISNDTLSIDFSTRYRNLKTCHNQDTGIPPFKVERT